MEQQTNYCPASKYPSVCTARGKKLFTDLSTSIQVNVDLLENNERLVRVPGTETNVDENRFYLVKDTNTVIFHVVRGYAVLVDYIVDRKKIINLPCELSKYPFHISITAAKDKNQRDWVKTGNANISYIIRDIIHGTWYTKLNRKFKRTINHEAETYDERLKNSRFVSKDKNRKSHRVRVEIKTMEDLDDFIDDIQQNEGVDDGIYFDKQNEKKRKSRHFVK